MVCGLGQEQRNILRQGIKYVVVLLFLKVENILLCDQGVFVIFNTFWTFVLCLGVMSSSFAILLHVRAHAAQYWNRAVKD